MSNNYALIADLKRAAIAAGALESAISDFELDVEGYRLTSRAEIPAWIERTKAEFPHRFAVQTDEDAELCRSAFINGNLTDAGRLFVQVGEKRFGELKAQWSNGVPASERKRLNGKGDHSTNPWVGIVGQTVDARGRFLESQISKQISVVRSLGATKAAELAKVCGCRLGDLYAANFKRG